jgi:hypothetical protein
MVEIPGPIRRYNPRLEDFEWRKLGRVSWWRLSGRRTQRGSSTRAILLNRIVVPRLRAVERCPPVIGPSSLFYGSLRDTRRAEGGDYITVMPFQNPYICVAFHVVARGKAQFHNLAFSMCLRLCIQTIYGAFRYDYPSIAVFLMLLERY